MIPGENDPRQEQGKTERPDLVTNDLNNIDMGQHIAILFPADETTPLLYIPDGYEGGETLPIIAASVHGLLTGSLGVVGDSLYLAIFSTLLTDVCVSLKGRFYKYLGKMDSNGSSDQN